MNWGRADEDDDDYQRLLFGVKRGAKTAEQVANLKKRNNFLEKENVELHLKNRQLINHVKRLTGWLYAAQGMKVSAGEESRTGGDCRTGENRKPRRAS